TGKGGGPVGPPHAGTRRPAALGVPLRANSLSDADKRTRRNRASLRVLLHVLSIRPKQSLSTAPLDSVGRPGALATTCAPASCPCQPDLFAGHRSRENAQTI